DSRVEFHAEGPFYAFIESAVSDSSLRTDYENRNTFFQRITEISLAVAEKLRATLFTGTAAQLTFGPNAYAVPNGYGGLGKAYTDRPDIGLVFASADPVAAEVTAIAFLTHLYAKVPVTEKLPWQAVLALNGQAQELGRQSVWANPYIVHALRLGLGGESIRPFFKQVPPSMQEDLVRLMQREA
ncbi:MAG TPA: DUF362 domain-containing protein, partial [Methanomicrobiales archaeon]|nr:DUF362 domain-containing protein [Methanomicrobiales archaeon]